jgi:hypothetical protein
MKQRAIEVSVGGLILLAVGLVLGFVVLMGGLSFQPTYTVYVAFENPGGLTAGAPVRISGVKVGRVVELEFRGGLDRRPGEPDGLIRAVAKVEKRYQSSIHDDARWFVSARGVLGEMFLAVDPGTRSRSVLPDGASVQGVSPPRLDLLLSKATTSCIAGTAASRRTKRRSRRRSTACTRRSVTPRRFSRRTAPVSRASRRTPRRSRPKPWSPSRPHASATSTVRELLPGVVHGRRAIVPRLAAVVHGLTAVVHGLTAVVHGLTAVVHGLTAVVHGLTAVIHRSGVLGWLGRLGWRRTIDLRNEPANLPRAGARATAVGPRNAHEPELTLRVAVAIGPFFSGLLRASAREPHEAERRKKTKQRRSNQANHESS